MQIGFSDFLKFFFKFLSLCISSSAVIIHFINTSLKNISFWSTSRSLTYLDWLYDFHTLPSSNTGGEKSPKPTCAFDSESNAHSWSTDQTMRKADSWLSRFHQCKATKLLAQLKQSVLYQLYLVFPFEEFNDSGLQKFRARPSISFRFGCTQFLHNSPKLFQNTNSISSFQSKYKAEVS